MQPKITVLMSCYNAERWLSEAIESVLVQTYKDFEFIIVDDGSSDNTPEIIKRYADIDHRIRVISKTNSGLTDSLNAGISQAKGEWIARLDADDICLPHRLEEQVKYVKNNPKIVLLGSGCIEINEHGKFMKEHRYPDSYEALVYNMEKGKRHFAHSSAFLEKKL